MHPSTNGYKTAQILKSPLKQGEWAHLRPGQRTAGFGLHHRRQLDLGFGGWGSQVVQHHMQYVSAYPEADHIRARYFEVDSSDINSFAPDELIFLGDAPILDLVKEMMEDPQAHPELRAHIGDPEQLFWQLKNSSDNSQGADGHPDIGTLIGLFNLDWGRLNINNKLNTPIQELFYYPKNPIFHPPHGLRRPDYAQPLTTVAVSSLPGGTGGPNFETYTYHTRQRLKEDGAKNIQSIAILGMAGAFVEVHDKQSLYRNNVRALKQLWSKYEHAHLPLQFSLSSPIHQDGPPFSIIYLVDGGNKNAYRFKNSQQVAEVVAQAMRMMSCGEIAKTYAKYLQNVIPKTRYPYIASSFGTYSVQYDGAGLADQCAHWMGIDLLAASFLEPQPTADVKRLADVESYLQASKLKQLQDQLTKTVQGKPIEVAKLPARGRRQQLVSTASSVRRQQATRLTAVLGEVVAAQIKDQINQLRTWLQTLVNQPGGLQAGVQLLVALAQELSAFTQELKAQSDEIAAQAASRTAGFQAESEKSWYRRGWPRNLFHAHIKALMVDEYHYAQVLAYQEIVSGVITEVQAQKRALEGWYQDLTEFSYQLELQSQTVSQQRQPTSLVVESVLKPEEERLIYARYQPQELPRLLASRPQLRWEGAAWILRYLVDGKAVEEPVELLSEAGLARHLAFCRTGFEFMTEWGIETVLAAKGENPQRFVAALVERAAPLICLNWTRNHHSWIPLTVIASPHGDTQFFSNVTLEEGVTLVASGDKSKVDILNSIHGFTWKALSYAPAMLSAAEPAAGVKPEPKQSSTDEQPLELEYEDLPF